MCSGMGLIIDLAKTSVGHMGIHLGGGDAGMAQEFLHRTEVGPVAQHVRSETVSEGMWCNSLDAGTPGIGLDNQPEALAGQTIAVVVKEKRIAVAPTRQVRAARLPVAHHGLASLLAKGDLPL